MAKGNWSGSKLKEDGRGREEGWGDLEGFIQFFGGEFGGDGKRIRSEI